MRRHRFSDSELQRIPETLEALTARPGVAEVGFVEEEGVAYLKVDRAIFDK